MSIQTKLGNVFLSTTFSQQSSVNNSESKIKLAYSAFEVDSRSRHSWIKLRPTASMVCQTRLGSWQMVYTNELINTYIHTYIIGHYNPSVRIIDLVSHTTFIVCVNFIHKWRDLQFKVDPYDRFFWETFHGNFIYFSRVFARNLLRGNRRRNTFRISFWCLATLPTRPRRLQWLIFTK